MTYRVLAAGLLAAVLLAPSPTIAQRAASRTWPDIVEAVSQRDRLTICGSNYIRRSDNDGLRDALSRCTRETAPPIDRRTVPRGLSVVTFDLKSMPAIGVRTGPTPHPRRDEYGRIAFDTDLLGRLGIGVTETPPLNVAPR